jgi:hypothetical protein
MEVILKKYQGYANEYKFICEDDLGILSHPKSSLKDIALEEIDGPIIVKNLNHVKIKFDLLDLNKHSNLKPRCTFEFISAHNDENQTIRFDFNIANLRNPSNIPYSKSTNHIDLSISVKIDETFTD